MAVLFFILAAMMSLAPGRDHTALATATASAILAEPPLFKNDDDRMKTAALIVAIEFRESSLRNDISSKTNDHCAMQINRRPDLAKDAEACVRVGITMLRESMRMCPDHPIAFYASGPGACTNERSKKISNDRMFIAKRLAKVAPLKELPTSIRVDVAVDEHAAAP